MEPLSIVWFILIAVLWIGYVFLEGFDFGVGMLLRVVAKDDKERTAVVRTIGPHWDGNEVWLLTAGGATFAAFPAWYATMFSGMYLALFLILVLLILRISALEWRSKLQSAKWRNTWDWIHTVTAFLVPLVFGVAFSNLVQGMKITVQDRLALFNNAPGAIDGIAPADVPAAIDSGLAVFNLTGGFWSLFTPFTLLGGVMLLLVSLALGAQFLTLKSEGAIKERASKLMGPICIATTLVAAIWIVWGQLAFTTNVLAWIPLVIAALALIVSTAFSQKALFNPKLAFISASIGVIGAVSWIFAAMAPNVMKSSIDPAYSLTIPLASATNATLTVMTVVAAILVPIVLAYTIWSYWTFRNRISVDGVDHNAGLLPDKIRLGANFLTGKK